MNSHISEDIAVNSKHERFPNVVVVLSGKRKSGKDFIANLIQERLTEEICTILRLSGPLKAQYAKENGLDTLRLLDSSQYKETYREDMIKWGEMKRKDDPEYFCRLSTCGPESIKPVWIISDARRQTDIAYFRKYYPKETLTVRIQATDSVRKNRDFHFKPGVDDAESECGLDSYTEWHFVINNNEKNEVLDQTLNKLIKNIKEKMCQQN